MKFPLLLSLLSIQATPSWSHSHYGSQPLYAVRESSTTRPARRTTSRKQHVQCAHMGVPRGGECISAKEMEEANTTEAKEVTESDNEASLEQSEASSFFVPSDTQEDDESLNNSDSETAETTSASSSQEKADEEEEKEEEEDSSEPPPLPEEEEEETDKTDVSLDQQGQQQQQQEETEAQVSSMKVPKESKKGKHKSATKKTKKSRTKIDHVDANPKEKRDHASTLRSQGKEFHDEGNLEVAAICFGQAADLWESLLLLDEQQQKLLLKDDDDEEDQEADESTMVEECATCRLHEALCWLKQKNFVECIVACTKVLQDGVQVIVEEEQSKEAPQQQDGNELEDEQEEAQTTVSFPTIITTATSTPVSAPSWAVPGVMRARALHRRAKARLALDDRAGALQDARSAAFLGDRNAVALYGKLMREGPPLSSSSPGAPASSLFGSANPFASALEQSDSDPASSSPSSSLLESLLSGSNGSFGGNNNNGAGTDFGASSPFLSSPSSSLGSPFDAMGGLSSLMSGNADGNNNNNGSGGMNGLAKSVLQSLTKRLESDSTQQSISNYLQRANSQQIRSLATMAGLPLSEQHADRLAKFANGVTPQKIQKSVSWTKRIVYGFNVMRKTIKVIDKYRPLLILFVLYLWIKSAIRAPIPVKKIT